MSEPQFPQKEIMQANNENKQEDNKNTSLNGQNKEIERNNPSNNREEKEELKIGHFFLTPLQSIILNKKIPFGFKLETEENILKSVEALKNQAKKNKNNTKHKERVGRDIHRNGGTMLTKKRNQNFDNFENINNPEIAKIIKKCKKALERIKESEYAHIYYKSNNPDVPCLANIEKKVNNCDYKSFYDFEMDVRKIWSYHYNIQQNNDKTTKMSDEWENICAELDNQNNEMSMATIRERTDRISKDIQDYNNNVARENYLPAPVKKGNQQNNEHNKPMTVEEKNQLGNNIRSLNKEQLKGIIRILSENVPNQKSKYFEFDIDQLSTKKLRELEKYVKECLSSSSKINKNNSSNINNTHIKNSNIKTGYQKENQNNKSNNKANSAQAQNQALLKSNSKNENKIQENKAEDPTKKNNQSNKKIVKKNDSLSDSDSMSSDSSLSN